MNFWFSWKVKRENEIVKIDTDLENLGENNKMKILSIDLSTKQTGLVLMDDWAEVKLSSTIPEICGDRIYQIGDIVAVKNAVANILMYVAQCDGVDLILVEEAVIKTTPKYIAFCEAVINRLEQCLPNKVKGINAARWLPLADKTLQLKRKSFPKGRAGDKQWLAAIADKNDEQYTFGSQDEKDAYVMGLTYLLNKEKF